MLEKQIVIDQVGVTRDGHIEVRVAVLFIEDEKELAKVYRRHALSPGDDLTGQNERVTAIANAVWTPEVIAAYQRKLEILSQDKQGENGQT